MSDASCPLPQPLDYAKVKATYTQVRKETNYRMSPEANRREAARRMGTDYSTYTSMLATKGKSGAIPAPTALPATPTIPDPQLVAYNAGWNASKRTTTYDMDGPINNWVNKHGGEYEDEFTTGWIDHASDHDKYQSLKPRAKPAAPTAQDNRDRKPLPKRMDAPSSKAYIAKFLSELPDNMKLPPSAQSRGFSAVAKKNPTTAEGYKQMFAAVNTDEWGGGDVSISHLMPDGRRVWLYGDTLSAKNGFVHSSALVQKDGVLTPANGGKQILPNGGKDPSDPSREIIYWIDGVKQGPTADTLLVTAMEMSIGTAGPWDFRKTKDGQSRQALVKVLSNGNMKFMGWKDFVPTPIKGNPHLADDFKEVGPDHYTYGKVTHNIKLANGKYLTTTSQNYTDDFKNHVGKDGFKWSDYAPTIGSTKKKP